MQTLQKTVVLFTESQEWLFFFFFSLCFPADCSDHAATVDFSNWTNGCLLGIRMILVSLQNEFRVLMLAWEKEECYLLEFGLKES